MNSIMQNNPHIKRSITKMSTAILVCWTILIGLLLFWNLKNLRDTEVLLAENDARISWEKDVLFVYGVQNMAVYMCRSLKVPLRTLI